MPTTQAFYLAGAVSSRERLLRRVLPASGLRRYSANYNYSAPSANPVPASRHCRPRLAHGNDHSHRGNSVAVYGFELREAGDDLWLFPPFKPRPHCDLSAPRRRRSAARRRLCRPASVDPGSTGTHAQVTSTNIKDLAGFLQATGWLCLYGVNLATSTPALAAEEVGFAVSALGSNLLGIEIGNEPDEYGIAGKFFAGNWTFQEFFSRWNSFRSDDPPGRTPRSYHRTGYRGRQQHLHLDLALRPGGHCE